MNLLPARTTDFLIQLNFLLKCNLSASLRLLKWFISASTAHLQLSYELEDDQIFVNMYRHTGLENYVYPHEQSEQGSTNFQEI
jgi:hypothetical protein